jgi:hypothetical protein
MGQQIKLKKVRKEIRKAQEEYLSRALGNFKPMDMIKPKPRFFPRFIWNLLIGIFLDVNFKIKK